MVGHHDDFDFDDFDDVDGYDHCDLSLFHDDVHDYLLINHFMVMGMMFIMFFHLFS